MVEPPSADYDELTVDEVKDRVESGEYRPEEVYAYETDNKERVTLLRWLDDRVDTSDDPAKVTVAPTRKRRVATYWIDKADLFEPMRVPRTPKVEEAINNGDFQVVER